jgi:hypothetical protein
MSAKKRNEDETQGLDAGHKLADNDGLHGASAQRRHHPPEIKEEGSGQREESGTCPNQSYNG